MTIKDLMQRYKVTRQAILHFIKKNIETINAEGEHAKQISEGWQFDAEAVRIIDELRNFSQVAVIEQEESDRIKELQQENENLRQLLLIAQSDLIKTQKLLQDNQTQLLTAENQAKENNINLVRVQADLNIEKAKREIVEYKISEVELQLDKANKQLEKMKKRGLIDRIFNNF